MVALTTLTLWSLGQAILVSPPTAADQTADGVRASASASVMPGLRDRSS